MNLALINHIFNTHETSLYIFSKSSMQTFETRLKTVSKLSFSNENFH